MPGLFFSSNLPWSSLEIGSSLPILSVLSDRIGKWRFEKERNLFWQKNNDITDTCKPECTAPCLLQPSLWLQSRVFQSMLAGNSKYTVEIITLEDSQSHNTDFLPLITQQGSASCYTPAPGAAAHNVWPCLLLCASIPLLWVSDSANIYRAQVGDHNLPEWGMQSRAVNSYGLQPVVLTWQSKEEQGSFSSSITLHPTPSC